MGGIRSSTMRKILLAEPGLTLLKAVEKCCAFEVADKGVDKMQSQNSYSQSEDHHVDGIHSRNQQRLINKMGQLSTRPQYDQRKLQEFSECKFCLRKHKWGRKFCPAFGKNVLGMSENEPFWRKPNVWKK